MFQSRQFTPIRRYATLLAALCLLLGACADAAENQGPVEVIIVEDDASASPDVLALAEIVVEPETLELAMGQSATLVARALDEQGNVVDEVELIWSSYHTSIATVDDQGRVTAVGAGTAQIEAWADGIAGVVEVKVWASDRYRSVATGNDHTCAATWGGVVYCWGSNSVGQGARATFHAVSEPVEVSLPEPMVSVVAGRQHSCALTENGTAYCWGTNQYAQMGVGGSDTATVPAPPAPLQGLRFESLYPGRYHSCGVTTDAELYCWGYNAIGHLIANHGDFIAQPTRVHFPKSISKVQVNDETTCGLATDGELFCWGSNFMLILGSNRDHATTPVSVSPQHRFVDFAMGETAACGITTEGPTLCWGQDLTGELGRGEDPGPRVPQPVITDQTFVSLTGAGFRFCGKTAGNDLYCWGRGRFGSLGDGTHETRRVPVRALPDAKWTGLSLARDHGCGIDEDGHMSCWGSNVSGQIGDGRILIRNAPQPVASQGITFSKIFAADSTTCAQSSDNLGFYCWGSNEIFQLDSTGRGHFNSPTALLPEVGLQEVALGFEHTCGRKAGGQAICWGGNTRLQLGNGYSWATAQPLNVHTNLRFKGIYTGMYHSCALSHAWEAFCWGDNTFHQLGLPNASTIVSSVLTDARFDHLAMGSAHTCGLTAHGEVY